MQDSDKVRALFSNRRLVIATKHKKETVIAPAMEEALGVKCFVPANFDTDVLGTFTGEIIRKHNPITTARNKCLMAMASTHCDLGIASEGSFGAHPTMFFVPADEEFLIMIDKKHDLEIVARELSVDTNYNGSAVKSEEELVKFALAAKFPDHGLILRVNKDNTEDMYKGITDWSSLKRRHRQLVSRRGTAYVETDMRAMYNPTRMTVIGTAAQKLVDKINSCCPRCDAPGFAITETKPGLPCSFCGLPTQLTMVHIYSCIKCQFTKEDSAPFKHRKADPQYCDRCNP